MVVLVCSASCFHLLFVPFGRCFDMSQMTTFISDVLNLVADFLWAEPIRYFVALGLLLFVLNIIIRIVSFGSRSL